MGQGGRSVLELRDSQLIGTEALWQLISDALFTVRSAHWYVKRSKGSAAAQAALSCVAALKALETLADVLFVEDAVATP